MSPLEGTLVAALIVKTLVVIMLVAAVCRSQRTAWQLYEIEHPTPSAKVRPITGTDLNAGVDIRCFVTADDVARGQWRRVKVCQPTADTRAGTTGTVYYGQRFSAAIFDHIELVDMPETVSDHEWIRDHLMTRIAPGGKLRLSKDMVPHGKSD